MAVFIKQWSRIYFSVGIAASVITENLYSAIIWENASVEALSA